MQFVGFEQPVEDAVVVPAPPLLGSNECRRRNRDGRRRANRSRTKPKVKIGIKTRRQSADPRRTGRRRNGRIEGNYRIARRHKGRDREGRGRRRYRGKVSRSTRDVSKFDEFRRVNLTAIRGGHRHCSAAVRGRTLRRVAASDRDIPEHGFSADRHHGRKRRGPGRPDAGIRHAADRRSDERHSRHPAHQIDNGPRLRRNKSVLRLEHRHHTDAADSCRARLAAARRCRRPRRLRMSTA